VMTNLPNLSRCIWCKNVSPAAQFTSRSHVVSENLGNVDQEVLPPGIVCDKCNHHFGLDVEQILLSDPFFNIWAYLNDLKDPKGRLLSSRLYLKDQALERRHQIAQINSDIQEDKVITTIDYKCTLRTSTVYDMQRCRFLSRLLYKIAFETLAYAIFVEGKLNNIDLFHSMFDYVRQWSRFGQPFSPIRPVLRPQRVDINEKRLPRWTVTVREFNNSLLAEAILFNDWYAVDLTSPPKDALQNLSTWAHQKKPGESVYCLANGLEPVKS
jgi:hypothetical protein